jgi:RimJ/RimL family protein N-acetyltransferase
MTDEKRSLPKEIQTPRLRLCYYHAEAAEEVNAAVRATFTDLNLWMPWAKEIPTVEETRKFAQESEEKFQAGTDFSYQLRDRETNAFYGMMGLHTRNGDVPSFEIGYWAAVEGRGRGLVTESALCLTYAGFTALGANRMIIRCDSRNDRSRGVAERCGYIYESAERNGFRDNAGNLATMLWFTLTPEDFEKLKAEGRFYAYQGLE